MNRSVILVSGAPATGKTHLAKELATALEVPYFSKDLIKESLFDSLGYSDRNQSKYLGKASYGLLLEIACQLSRAGVRFVLENAFRATDGATIATKLDCTDILQIYCHTERSVLLSRFKARTSSGERHPGHVDHENGEELIRMLDAGVYGPLDLPGDLIKLDTTNFSSTEYRDACKDIHLKCITTSVSCLS